MMARRRNPSGIPDKRILGPIYGPREIDVDARLGTQHEGVLRTRRVLLVVSAIVGVVVVVVAIAGNTASASGITVLLLAPLLLVLIGTQVAVLVTRPKTSTRSGDSQRRR